MKVNLTCFFLVLYCLYQKIVNFLCSWHYISAEKGSCRHTHMGLQSF